MPSTWKDKATAYKSALRAHQASAAKRGVIIGGEAQARRPYSKTNAGDQNLNAGGRPQATEKHLQATRRRYIANLISIGISVGWRCDCWSGIASRAGLYFSVGRGARGAIAINASNNSSPMS